MLLAIGCGAGNADPDAGPRDAGADAGSDAGMTDGGPPAFAPDSYCPGSSGCETATGQLRVGAAAIEITPTIDATTDVLEVDADGNGEYEHSEGDRFAERNGVPGYQGVWMAGFGNARGATGVHDPQWARAIALQNGETTIVVVAVDVIGWFIDEMDQVREAVADLGVDFVSFTSTHCHECRDVVGLWGLDEASTGVDPAYNAFVRERAAQAIRMAVAALRPANVQYASFDLRDLPGGSLRYISDARDPHIVDDRIRLMRFLEDGTETTIATLINFGSHAEYLDDRNTLLSSDFPHWLRDGIENGADGPDGRRAGVGGVAVFFQGAVGSQIGPSGARVTEWDGTPIDRGTDPMAFTTAMGSQMAYHCLGALADGSGAVTDDTAAIGFRTKRFFVDVRNVGYHYAILLGIFQREGYHWDPAAEITPENEPDVLTEVSVIDIGRAQIITVPGELDPSLFLGGYDGSYTPPEVEIVSTSATNPPDLSMAPPPPYLRNFARADAEHVFLFGLTNDFLGYLLPEYDYELDPDDPYLSEAPGDHYEETNSVGIDGWPLIRSQIEALLQWSAP